MRPRLRSLLSSLKKSLVCCDLQDIYLLKKNRLNEFLAVSLAKDETGARQVDLVYQLNDSPDALKLIELIRPLNQQERRFAVERLDAGDKVVIGYEKNIPVFFGWLMFEEIEMTYGVFVSVPKGSAFGYNLFTKSSHRRRGAMTGFYHFVRNYLKENDFHTLYIGISPQNRPSINAHLKNGFQKTGYFYTLKLLGTCFTLARFEYAKRFHIN